MKTSCADVTTVKPCSDHEMVGERDKRVKERVCLLVVSVSHTVQHFCRDFAQFAEKGCAPAAALHEGLFRHFTR